MKKLFSLIVVLMMSSGVWSQNVFTVLYATSDDGFVNVRQQPSMSGRVLTQLYGPMHGLGRGVLLAQNGKWTKMRVDNKVIGWAYSKYVGSMNWFRGQGAPKLVAAKTSTPIYQENFKDGAVDILFTTVPKGTIIADEYQESEDGKYYVLITGHDYLFIKKTDVIVK